MRNMRETNRASLPSSLHLSSCCQGLLSGSFRTPPLLATHLPIHAFLEDNRKLEALFKSQDKFRKQQNVDISREYFWSRVLAWQGSYRREQGEGTWMTKSEDTTSSPPQPASVASQAPFRRETAFSLETKHRGSFESILKALTKNAKLPFSLLSIL